LSVKGSDGTVTFDGHVVELTFNSMGARKRAVSSRRLPVEAIRDVQLQRPNKFGFGGFLRFALAGQDDAPPPPAGEDVNAIQVMADNGLSWAVLSALVLTASRQVETRVHADLLELEPVGSVRTGNAMSTDAAVAPLQTGSAPTDPQGLDQFPRRLSNVVRNELQPGEDVLFVLKGHNLEALVACADRCFIAKTGYWTGNTLGGRVTNFQYANIEAVHTRTGLVGVGYLELVTAGFPSRERSAWAKRGDKARDPAHAPNCLVANQRLFIKWSAQLAQAQGAGSTGSSTPCTGERAD
jgi:hypothetical protein